MKLFSTCLAIGLGLTSVFAVDVDLKVQKTPAKVKLLSRHRRLVKTTGWTLQLMLKAVIPLETGTKMEIRFPFTYDIDAGE